METLPGYMRAVRFVFALLALVYFSCVVIQVFLAGMATFVDSGDWSLHTTFVKYFELLSPLMFLLSFFGRIRGVLRWFSLGLFALTSFQYMSVSVFAGVWVLPVFHTVVALLLFWSSLHITKGSFAWLLPKTQRAHINRDRGALEAE